VPREKIDVGWANEDFDWAISIWAKVCIHKKVHHFQTTSTGNIATYRYKYNTYYY
jgi:hypothetical protein